jgi:hypothetical protein
MASFTDVGNTLVLATTYIGEKVDVAISGTYVMTIKHQRELGAKGSGAWEDIASYAGNNTTFAATYYALTPNERTRLILHSDTSGTATVTLTNPTTVALQTQRSSNGTELYSVYEDGIVPRFAPVVLTTATVLNREQHSFRKLFLDNATGFKVNLPDATGSGDEYEFYVITKVTSGSHEINAFEVGADVVNGLIVGVDPPGDEFTWGAQGTENMVSLGGTSNATGGFQGDRVKFVDVKAGLWHASGVITQDGSEATPFGTDS